ncbi:MAG: polysaccharide lyase [Reichenbachiella sp.]|uniref:polysaccharide lyase n=1 Tax=Reichenbachiella sp. TaxID=2184521 RepID=UPI003299E514
MKRITSLILILSMGTAMVYCQTDANEPIEITETEKPTVKPVGLIAEDNFESGTWNNFWVRDWRQCCEYSAQFQSDVVRSGQYAVRFELDYLDGQYQIINGTKNNGTRSSANFGDYERYGKIGTEEWYGLSTYLEPPYDPDPCGELIFQWHGQADYDLGEGSLSPPLALYLEDGEYVVKLRHTDKRVATNNDLVVQKLFVEPYVAGQWVDWIFHMKWDYKGSGNGFVEVWKNGVQVVDYQGPNCYNDLNNLFWTMGVYKWPWKTCQTGEDFPACCAENGRPYDDCNSNVTNRVMYVDNFKVAGAGATLEDMKLD